MDEMGMRPDLRDKFCAPFEVFVPKQPSPRRNDGTKGGQGDPVRRGAAWRGGVAVSSSHSFATLLLFFSPASLVHIIIPPVQRQCDDGRRCSGSMNSSDQTDA